MSKRDTRPTPALPSATVILMRERMGAPEVFMAQRHAQAAFGAVYAFPGGVVDSVDRRVHEHLQGLAGAQANRRLTLDEHALDFYAAAIRELLEEAGVLLARTAHGEWPEPGTAAVIREATLSDKAHWPKLLLEHELALAANALHYVGHWETPFSVSPRFSARFFLAELPPGQCAEHDGRELVASRWLRPREVLDAARAGELKLAFPTMTHLRMLAEHSTLKEIRHWAETRWRDGIEKIRPWIIMEAEGRRRFVLPGDPEYPEDRA